MNRRAFWLATGTGLLLQLAMVWAGHYNVFVREKGFAIGGLTISLIAGLVFAWSARASLGQDVLGGAIAGGLCALLGIAVSVLLGDVPTAVLGFGTLGSIVTGLLGGAIGRAIFR